MEVFSLQWLLLNYSAKFLRIIKLNYIYCNQRRLFFLPAWTYYTLFFYLLPRSFQQNAVKLAFPLFFFHCSTAYTRCSVLIFTSLIVPSCLLYSTLKWQHYIQEVLYLLAGARILHFISELLFQFVFFLKKTTNNKNMFANAKLSPHEVTQNSKAMIIQDAFFSCNIMRCVFF